MYTEKLEGLIISEILFSSKHSENLAKKYLGATNKLFESAFDNDTKYQPKNLLENFRNNKFSYFQNVKETINNYLLQMNNNDIVALNESFDIYNKASEEFKISIENFIYDLDNEINNLSLQNDFNIFDTYSPIVKKTLLFQKKPINILGFNVFEILNPTNIISKELKEKFNADIKNDLKLLLFNKSDKEFYFVFEKSINEKVIIFYNIYSNNLDYFQLKNLYEEYGIENTEFFEMIWQNEKKITENFIRYINGNTIELYRNFNKFNIVFEDNLYKDIAWDRFNKERKKHSVVK